MLGIVSRLYSLNIHEDMFALKYWNLLWVHIITLYYKQCGEADPI